jgi:hypothetical protein
LQISGIVFASVYLFDFSEIHGVGTAPLPVIASIAIAEGIDTIRPQMNSEES